MDELYNNEFYSMQLYSKEVSKKRNQKFFTKNPDEKADPNIYT